MINGETMKKETGKINGKLTRKIIRSKSRPHIMMFGF
jgi:hypothetical protein